MKPLVPARIVGDSVVVEDEPFEVDGLLGLYRGVDLDAGRRVLVRQPKQALRGDRYFLERLQARAVTQRALARTSVPEVFQVYGDGTRVCATVEEHVGGTRLTPLLDALESAGEQLALPVALAVARAVATVFARAMNATPSIQLEIPSSGIAIDPQGHVRVLPEFKEVESDQFQGARSGASIQIPLYMSPEEIRGMHQGPLAPQRSMYGLGMLLHELIGGRIPLAGETFADIIRDRIQHDAPSIAEAREGLPVGLIAFVDRCTRLDPTERFPSWSELVETLDAASAWFPRTGPAEVRAYVATLLSMEEPAPLDLRAFDGWEHLPRTGWTRMQLGVERPAAPPEAELSPDPDAVYAGSDGRPMYRVHPGLLVDARPVSTAEFERFLIQSGREYPADWERGADPASAVRRVSLDDARAYADWARKRLPCDPEWEQAVAALGAGKLATGEVWEWTASPHPDLGWVVRGGRWRDRPDQAPDPSHRSCEVGPASDLGFRLVVDG